MNIKLGDSGEQVKKIQKELNITVDGVFGNKTQAAVMEFQRMYKLVPDGIVGQVTWLALMGNVGTDTSITNNVAIHKDIFYTEYLLTEGVSRNINDKIVWTPNYYAGPVSKKWMILHHTAGWENPYQVVDIWSKDEKTVGTEWVVGGQHINNGNKKYDGEIVRAMPSNSFAWHLTIGNTNLHRESIGIEICSFGGLTKKGNDYYTYVNGKVDPSQVCDIGYDYRGFRYFHKLSDMQINSVKVILLDAQTRYGIDMKKGLVELIKVKGVKAAFDMCDVNYINNNPGLYTHGNVYSQKNDIFPQQELIDMLMSL